MSGLEDALQGALEEARRERAASRHFEEQQDREAQLDLARGTALAQSFLDQARRRGLVPDSRLFDRELVSRRRTVQTSVGRRQEWGLPVEREVGEAIPAWCIVAGWYLSEQGRWLHLSLPEPEDDVVQGFRGRERVQRRRWRETAVRGSDLVGPGGGPDGPVPARTPVAQALAEALTSAEELAARSRS